MKCTARFLFIALAMLFANRCIGDEPTFGPDFPDLDSDATGRWWHPLDEQAGGNPVPDSPLPWTGEYEDGHGNLIRMLVYRAGTYTIKAGKDQPSQKTIKRLNPVAAGETARIELW